LFDAKAIYNKIVDFILTLILIIRYMFVFVYE